MRWLPIAVLVVGLGLCAWMLLGVVRPDTAADSSTELTSVLERPDVATLPAEARGAMPGGAPTDGPAPEPLVAAAAAPPACAPTGGLAGRVVSGAGAPLAGARVSAFCDVELRRLEMRFGRVVPPVASTTSDATGRFALLRIPALRPLVLRIEGPEGGRLVRDGFATLPGEVLDLDDLTLSEGARLAGLVTDAGGQAVSGADVLLSAGDGAVAGFMSELLTRCGCDVGETPAATGVRSVKTDARGGFAFADCQPIESELAVFRPGFEPHTEMFALRPGESRTMNLQLSLGARIAGRVIDDRGRPVAEARVSAMVENDFLLTCTRSDAQGRFVLQDLPSKTHLLRASRANDLVSSEVLVEPGAGDTVLMLAAVGQEDQYTVEVVDETGRPVPAFDLWTADGDEATLSGSYTNVQGDGPALNCSRAQPMPVVLWARTPGRTSRALRVPITGSSVDHVRLQLQASVPVEGRVLDALTRTPLPGAEVQIGVVGNARPPGATLWADETGAFRIEDVPPGAVSLRARTAGYADATLQVAEDAGRVVDILLSPIGTLVVQANATWRHELGGHADVLVWNRLRKLEQRVDAGQLPCVVTALAAGRYSVEIWNSEPSAPRRSHPLEFDVGRSGVTRVDVSSLTLDVEVR